MSRTFEWTLAVTVPVTVIVRNLADDLDDAATYAFEEVSDILFEHTEIAKKNDVSVEFDTDAMDLAWHERTRLTWED